MIWKYRKFDPKTAESLAQDLAVPLKVGEFLAARGFKSAKDVKHFVRADLKNIPNPMTLSGMPTAVDILLKARHADSLIAICGDYDADGLTATALLCRGLKRLGHKITSRIPHRLSEGYGLRKNAIDELKEQGAKVLITVDSGISDYEAIEYAVSLGMDVVVTDHHKLPPKLPPAAAIVNPHLGGGWEESPLAGVGVAFMYLAALKTPYLENNLIPDKNNFSLIDSLPLVALGTIADMAPLTGVNRVLVRQGLKMLASTSQAGLVALKTVTNLKDRPNITARDVGFLLAPRLNAAGRMGSPQPALDLLLEDDIEIASDLADNLEAINRERYNMQNKLCLEALEKCEVEISPDSLGVILAENHWPKGLIGLAASKVAEKLKKPTILLSVEDGIAVGSGRSASGFNLYNALDALRHLFLTFGGHSQAAGLSMDANNIELFKEAFEEEAKKNPPLVEEELLIDCQVTLGDLDALAPPLASLEPFGQKHPSPILVLKNAKVLDVGPTKSKGDQHLKITLSDGPRRLNLVGFNLAPRLYEFKPIIDAALTLDFSFRNGRLMPSWKLLDFQ